MGMGERIRSLRKKAGLSQFQLGAQVGAEANTISRWETDKIEASHNYVVKLADALNTTTDYLLGRTEEVSISPERSVSHMKEQSTNTGMLVYTLKNGDRMEMPPTPDGYAMFEKMARMAMVGSAPGSSAQM